MPDPLIEELALDLTPALEGLDPLNEALARICANFGLSFGDAITQTIASLALPDIDVAPLAAAVEGAITEGAATPVVVDADVTPIAAALLDLTSTPETVEVGADTTSAKDAIDALSGEAVTVEVDADTTAAQDALGQVGSKAHSASGEVAGLGGAVLGTKIASGLAAGEVGAFGEAAHLAGANAVGAVAGISALAAFVGETVKVAADAEAQTRRFATAFGPLREAVEHIDIGGLNITIEELGKRSGTAVANLEAAASKIADLGHSAGASDKELVGTTQRILALAGQISVTNPRLGDAAEIADRLTGAFARGGRALVPFGISLTSAEISARALANTGKSAASDLSIFEKATAGAQLQAEKLGGTLGTSFEAGSRNAQVQLRAIKVALEETFVGIGTPLLAPVVELSKALVPLAAAVGGVLGTILVPALQAIAPIVTVLATGLQGIADVLGVLPAPLLDVAIGVGVLAFAFANAAATVAVLGAAVDVAFGPIGIAVAVVAALGAALTVFGDHAKKAEVDSKGLGDAVFGTASSAEELSGKLATLSGSLVDYEKKQLGATKGVEGALLGLTLLGVGYDDVAKALGGTNDEFLTFDLGLKNSAAATGIHAKAIEDLTRLIETQRGTLQGLSEAKLEDLVATKQITQAEADRLIVQAGGNLKTRDTINDTTDYVTALKTATEAAQRHVDAERAHAEATGQTALAYAALRLEVVSGDVALEGADKRIASLGLTADQTSAFIAQAAQAVTDFATEAVGKLPDASAAFQDLNADSKVTFDEIAANFKKTITDSLQFGAVVARLSREGFVNLAAAVAEQGPAAAAAVANLFKNAPQKIPELERLAEGVRASVDAAAVAIDAAAPNIVNHTALLAESIEKKFHVDFAGSIDADLRSAFGALINFPVPAAAGKKGEEIGHAIAGGAVKGVLDQTFTDGPLERAGGELIGAASKGARKAGGIHSASTLFADLGRQLVEGLALGLNDHRPASAASGRLVAATASPFDNLALPSGFVAATPTPTPAPARAGAATASVEDVLNDPGSRLLVNGPLIGEVHADTRDIPEMARLISRELAWNFSP